MRKTIILLATLAMAGVAMSQTGVEKVSAVRPDSEIFTLVEQDPQFPGGNDALYQYLGQNAHYPDKAKADGIQGTVYLTFIIEKDGSISNIRVLRSPSDLLSQEAIRLVKAMPKWKPGKQRGKQVRVQYNLPINFQID